MSTGQTLERGQAAFQTKAWGVAFTEFLAADRESALGPGDLLLLAQTAFLIGKDTEGMDTLFRAHQAFVSCGEILLAARCAFWMGFVSLINGEAAKAGGWLARGSRMLEDQPECVEKGYFFLPKAYRCFQAGDTIAARAAFGEAASAAERFGDKDLLTLALQGEGRAFIREGDIERGVALLDEAMVAVTAGDVSPLNAGRVYCSVLEGCGEIFDLQRAQEWTAELERWCESQPDLVPFRGHCLVRRSELLYLRGEWAAALEWAQRSVERLSPHRADGASAYYQLGEVLRMLGRVEEAEEAYRQASESSRVCGPGLALMRLAQGRLDAALAAIRRVADEKLEPGRRAQVLDAYVEIAIAAQNIENARESAGELRELADRLEIPFLRALSARASAAVLLAEGKAAEALTGFRQSWNLWQELQAPYEAARVQCSIALACLKLGDRESAFPELSAARATFQRLGAATDLARVESLFDSPRSEAAGGLTAREVEVLQLVASGMTNKEIAGRLGISEKTVARHLSNMFTKLDLS